MTKKAYLYVTFNNTMDSITAEKLFKANEVPGRLVLIPRELSAGCGMAWRSEIESQSLIEDLAKNNDLKLKQVAII